MIGISTQTYDLDGTRLFLETDRAQDSENKSGARRVSRTATLDGDVLVSDMGYADGDRTIKVREQMASLAAIAFARYIVEHYQLVVVTTDDGAYTAVPSEYGIDSGDLVMTMLVTEKISE